MIRPPALREGDLVRVIAPASPFDRGRFDKGVRVLEELGFRVSWRPDVFTSAAYLAGDDERRAQELTEAFDDPQVRGIVCARGGYGTPRLLARLDFAALAKNPKVFVGFSDVTALLLAFHRAGLVTFHGPMTTGRMSEAAFSREDKDSFAKTVGEAKPPGVVGEGRVLVPGDAEGPLVGGNLALVAALCGTPWAPLAQGAILFLEDVGEKPYRIDRRLTPLEHAGVLGAAAGIAFGRFSGCENPADPSQKVDDLLVAFAKKIGKPAVAGLPFGHDGENRTLPVGVRARLSNGVLSVIEPAVEAARVG
jgi:muramoyltetrapeptide carboxypeptidase